MQTVWHFGYFWPVVVYLESKIMYRSGKIQWWPCKIELKHTKTKAKTKNEEETLVSAIFGPIVTKWIPKSVYFCRSKQWWSHIKQRKTKPKQAQTNNLAKNICFFVYTEAGIQWWHHISHLNKSKIKPTKAKHITWPKP